MKPHKRASQKINTERITQSQQLKQFVAKTKLHNYREIV